MIFAGFQPEKSGVTDKDRWNYFKTARRGAQVKVNLRDICLSV